MATTGVGSATAASAALLGNNLTTTTAAAGVDLADITEEVTALVDQIKLQQSTSVKEFEKQTNDVTIDNNMTARDIGILRKNDSRLNLFSALSKGDSVDVFRFKVSTTANTKLGTLIADPTDKALFRVQVFAKGSGRLVADQDPESGEAYANFQKLEAGNLELTQGDYVMRISRLGGQDPRSQNEIQYAVQLSQGIYKNDFDTVEKGRSASQDEFGFAISLGAGTDQLIKGLSAGFSFISNLPAIGTSATSKLTGALYDALF